jgi:hypothetical protein
MQPFLSNYYGATRFVLEKRLKIDPTNKPDIYLDINIYKKQIEQNKFYSQRDYFNRQQQEQNQEQKLNKQETGELRRMTLGSGLDRFNPDQ